MIPIGTPARVYLVTTTTLIGLLTAAIGLWCLLDPRSFAGSVGFPAHEHFVHDVGAFQVGLGVMLLLALIWSDALATVLAGYIVGNTVHTVNHIVDLDLGGSASKRGRWARRRWYWLSRSCCAYVNSGMSWATSAWRPTRGWPGLFCRRRSGSPHFARMEPREPVRSASR